MKGLVRSGKHKVRGSGFLVTWDVDNEDRTAGYGPWSFLFGGRLRVGGWE